MAPLACEPAALDSAGAEVVTLGDDPVGAAQRCATSGEPIVGNVGVVACWGVGLASPLLGEAEEARQICAHVEEAGVEATDGGASDAWDSDVSNLRDRLRQEPSEVEQAR